MFRFYDPESGRYTQPDPIGLAGGVNLYAYPVDPVTKVDPLGLKICKGNARILQGNSRHIGKAGAYGSDNIIQNNSGIIIPEQVGLTGTGQMRQHLDDISATLSDGTPLFDGVKDNMGPREARQRFIDNRQFVIELPGRRDLGTQEVLLTLPDTLECPPGTHEISCVTCNN